MRTKEELRDELRKLRREYHRITCGELRDICRRYGDKAIYLIDANGNEVPGAFSRIHDFIYSYRWELHPFTQEPVKVVIDTIGSARGPEHDGSPVKYLVNESFNQWGGYIDVPVYICETNEGGYPRLPAFGEYTICGDRIIFRRTHEAYEKYEILHTEWREVIDAEEKKRNAELEKQLKDPAGFSIPLPKCARKFPPLFASDTPLTSKQPPRNREERRHHTTLAEQLVSVSPIAGPIGYAKALKKIYKEK